jgi:hypothetical protein
MQKSEIAEIAKEVYEQYSPRFAGNCARASFRLLRRYLEAGVSHLDLSLWIAKSREGSHVYVSCGDYFVDATLEQFGAHKGPWVSREFPELPQGYRVVTTVRVTPSFADDTWRWFSGWRQGVRPSMATAEWIGGARGKEK